MEAEGAGLGDSKSIPSSQRALQDSALLLPFHNPSGDFQVFSSLQPRPELEQEEEDGSSPALLHEEHKALFLSSKAHFFSKGRLISPERAYRPAPQVLSHAKQELTNCIFAL